MPRKKKEVKKPEVPEDVEEILEEFEMLGNRPTVDKFMSEYGIKSRDALLDLALGQVGLSFESIREEGNLYQGAATLYISSHEFEPEEISEKLGIPVEKIKNWRDKFHWDVAREAARIESFNQAVAQRVIVESKAIRKTKDVIDNLSTVLMAKLIEKKDELKGKDALTGLLTALKLKAQLDGDLGGSDSGEERMLAALYGKLQEGASKKITAEPMTFEAKIINESKAKESEPTKDE